MKKIIPFKKEIVFKTHISEITSISLEHQLDIDNLNITGEFIVSGEYKMTDNSTTVEPFNLNIPFEIVLDEKYDTSLAMCDIDDFYYEIINDSILSISIDVCIDKLKEVLIKEKIPDLREKKDIIEELFDENKNNEQLESNYFEDEKESKLNNSKTEEFRIEEDKKIEESIIDEDNIIEGTVIMEEKNILNNVNESEEQIVDERFKITETVKDNITENKILSKDEVSNKINSLFNQMTEDETYISYNVYIIREGDTIESISEKYSISVEEIGKYNSLNDLKLGDKLIIPSVK